MIRFRLGQTWKREDGPAIDAFAFEIEGLDILASATEESLVRVVTDLVDALDALSARGERVAQVSLTESLLELCLAKVGDRVEVSVCSLGRPARRARQLSVDLEDLRQAAARCARTLIADVTERSRSQGEALARQLSRRLKGLENPRGSKGPDKPVHGFSHRATTVGPWRISYALNDPEDRVRAFAEQDRAGLASLICDGSVAIAAESGELWSASGPPFLIALELVRQAQELAATASEPWRGPVLLQPAGAGVELSIRAEDELGHFIRAACELGLALGFALISRHRSQGANPYLADLTERCRTVLGRVRPAQAPEPTGVARQKKARAQGTRPLSTAGAVRRVRFQPLWQKQSLGGNDIGRLALGRAGPVFSSPQMACGFAPDGTLLYRRVAQSGVAADAAGRVLAASPHRIWAFLGRLAGARWLHDHDGLPVGPELWVKDSLWLCLSEGRTLVAFHEMTGREAWRLAPPQTQRCFVAVQGHRVLAATDGGILYGLDLVDGQVRYRMRALLPFVRPPVPWGRRVLCSTGRREAGALFALDAHRGPLPSASGVRGPLWTYESDGALLSLPVALPNRVFVAAARGAGAALVCLSGRGQRLWEQALPDAGEHGLLTLGHSVIAVSRRGAAAAFDADGTPLWRVAGATEAIARTLAPQRSRGLVLLPGATVRAVNPQSGEVVGEVDAGAGLVDLAVDGRLNLYLLDDDGALRAFRLGTHLSVVGA